MDINEFIGKKAKEVVEGEVVKQVVKKTKEPTFLDELKDAEKLIKEVFGDDYIKFKKKSIQEIKTFTKNIFAQIKGKPIQQSQPNKTQQIYSPKPQIEQKIEKVEKIEKTTKMNIDLDKIFIGLDLFLEFSNKKELKVGELREFLEKQKENVNKIFEEQKKILNAINLFIKFAGDEKKVSELKDFVEENKTLIEGVLN